MNGASPKPSSQPGPVVREAVPGDLPFLIEATLGNALDSEGIRLDPETVRRGVQAILADPNRGRTFIAQDPATKSALGSCYVTFEWSDWHAAWYWWIQSVFVPAAQRRRGVYRALHDAVAAAALRQGDVRAVRLYVEQGNGPAIAAYEALGMMRTHYLVYDQVVAPK